MLDYAYQRIRHEHDWPRPPKRCGPSCAICKAIRAPQAAAAGYGGKWPAVAPTAPIAPQDVVITAHGTAVVVRYNARTMPAPVVIAKGTGRQGERLAVLAARRQATTMHREPLAQALHAEGKSDQPIPPTLYLEVAAVLAQAAKSRRGITARCEFLDGLLPLIRTPSAVASCTLTAHGSFPCRDRAARSAI